MKEVCYFFFLIKQIVEDIIDETIINYSEIWKQQIIQCFVVEYYF
jgi:hypothetical protein